MEEYEHVGVVVLGINSVNSYSVTPYQVSRPETITIFVSTLGEREMYEDDMSQMSPPR